MKPFIILPVCLGLLLTHRVKGQTAAADNKISESITYSDPPKGKDLYGVFEGRTPCMELSRKLRSGLPPDCDHLKWQLILYRDTLTLAPTTYQLMTEMFDRRPLKGRWRITKGTKTDPAAVVYAFDYGVPGESLFLEKGDENVLFILDENRAFRTGNLDFSYTLNRVQKVRHEPPH